MIDSYEVRARILLGGTYRKHIDTAVQVTCGKWPLAEEDDVRQEASQLVLSYAGMISGWHYNWIAAHKESARNFDALLIRTLLMDLDRQLMRQDDHLRRAEFDEESVEIAGGYYDPSDAVAANMDWAREMPRLRRDYPVLLAIKLDRKTETSYAAEAGVSERTVRNRLAEERKLARDDPFFEEYASARADEPEAQSSSGSKFDRQELALRDRYPVMFLKWIAGYSSDQIRRARKLTQAELRIEFLAEYQAALLDPDLNSGPGHVFRRKP